MAVTIFRGIPGSGKSTKALMLVESARSRSLDAFIYSADQYHINKETGLYEFDPMRAPEAHACCLRSFAEELIGGKNPEAELIVDNTNCTVAEVAPYAALAQAYGHMLNIITIECPLLLALQRNVHDVPPERIGYMAAALSTSILPPWWPHQLVQAEE